MDDATVRTPRASSLRRAEIVFGAKTVSRDQNDEHRDRHLGARALARSRSRAASGRSRVFHRARSYAARPWASTRRRPRPSSTTTAWRSRSLARARHDP